MSKMDESRWRTMLFGGRVSREEEKRMINENWETIDYHNRRNLLTVAFVLGMMFLLLFVCSFFVPEMGKSRIVFTIAMTVLLSLYLVSPILHRVPVIPLGYFSFVSCIIFACIASVKQNPDSISIIIFFVLISFPITFLDKSRRVVLTETVGIVVYCVVMWLFKKPMIAFEETLNVVRFGFLGLVLGDLVRRTLLTSFDRKRLLEIKANLDGLTQIANRFSFDELTEKLKSSPLPVALVVCDIDGFKNINDTYGHVMGDATLKRVATLLSEYFRMTDVAVRLGGDEFAIVMPGSSSEYFDVIKERLKEINCRLAEPSADGTPVCVLSCGVSFSERGYKDELYKMADIALYEAKRNAKHKVRMYTGA